MHIKSKTSSSAEYGCMGMIRGLLRICDKYKKLVYWAIYMYIMDSIKFVRRLFIDALWSPAGKGPDLLALVCHFPIGILGQVWCLVSLIPDLCPFSYFQK